MKPHLFFALFFTALRVCAELPAPLVWYPMNGAGDPAANQGDPAALSAATGAPTFTRRAPAADASVYALCDAVFGEGTSTWGAILASPLPTTGADGFTFVYAGTCGSIAWRSTFILEFTSSQRLAFQRIDDASALWGFYNAGAVENWGTMAGTRADYSKSFSIAGGTYTHLVVTCTGNTVSFYLNGALQGTFALKNTIQAFSKIYTGGSTVNADNPQSNKADDIRCYNQALSADQITELYASWLPLNAPDSRSSRVLSLNFNSPAGSIVAQPGSFGACAVPTASWNDLSGGTFTASRLRVRNQDYDGFSLADIALSVTSADTGSQTRSDPAAPLLNGYLADDAVITLSGLNAAGFTRYAAYIYLANGDPANTSFDPIQINDRLYGIGSGNVTRTLASTTAWGDSTAPGITESAAGNLLVARDLSGDALTISAVRQGAPHTSIAGIQIVGLDRVTSKQTRSVGGAGAVWISSKYWTYDGKGSQPWKNNGNAVTEITNTTTSNYLFKVDGAIEMGTLIVKQRDILFNGEPGASWSFGYAATLDFSAMTDSSRQVTANLPVHADSLYIVGGTLRAQQPLTARTAAAPTILLGANGQLDLAYAAAAFAEVGGSGTLKLSAWNFAAAAATAPSVGSVSVAAIALPQGLAPQLNADEEYILVQNVETCPQAPFLASGNQNLSAGGWVIEYENNTLLLRNRQVYDLVWRGVESTWSTAPSSLGWLAGGTPRPFANGDSATFADLSGKTSENITLAGNVAPSALIVSNETTGYAIAGETGIIAVAGGIAKTGAASLAIDPRITAQSLAWTAGDLAIGNDSSRIPTAVTIPSGATLTLPQMAVFTSCAVPEGTTLRLAGGTAAATALPGSQPGTVILEKSVALSDAFTLNNRETLTLRGNAALAMGGKNFNMGNATLNIQDHAVIDGIGVYRGGDVAGDAPVITQTGGRMGVTTTATLASGGGTDYLVTHTISGGTFSAPAVDVTGSWYGSLNLTVTNPGSLMQVRGFNLSSDTGATAARTVSVTLGNGAVMEVGAAGIRRSQGNATCTFTLAGGTLRATDNFAIAFPLTLAADSALNANGKTVSIERLLKESATLAVSGGTLRLAAYNSEPTGLTGGLTLRSDATLLVENEKAAAGSLTIENGGRYQLAPSTALLTLTGGFTPAPACFVFAPGYTPAEDSRTPVLTFAGPPPAEPLAAVQNADGSPTPWKIHYKSAGDRVTGILAIPRLGTRILLY